MSTQDFGRQKRLCTAADYKAVFTNPQRSTDKHFVVLGMKTAKAVSRLGLAISKKQVKRAVDRNRIKRIVRESFRCYCAQDAGLDLVVMARQDTVKQNNQTLSDSLQRHWKTFSQT